MECAERLSCYFANSIAGGNIIERMSSSPISIDTKDNVRVIAGDGRVLMPGLIDALRP